MDLFYSIFCFILNSIMSKSTDKLARFAISVISEKGETVGFKV